MTLTDARRHRTDVGPANGMGDAYSPPMVGSGPVLCAVCNRRPAIGGRLTCSRICARALWDRPAVAW